jgi:hypothetical protein
MSFCFVTRKATIDKALCTFLKKKHDALNPCPEYHKLLMVGERSIGTDGVLDQAKFDHAIKELKVEKLKCIFWSLLYGDHLFVRSAC